MASSSQTVVETARDRLLLVAAELLNEAQGAEVSTRAITERAGVQAPTLYHHFGSKQGLLDAVIEHGFARFLAGRAGAAADALDPIDDMRAGWDLHVRFGLEHPAFYTRIYGRAVPGQPCGVIAQVEAMLLDALQPAARSGRLRVAPERAARQILAASTGVVLTLIAQTPETLDRRLSDDVRDAVLLGITIANNRRPAPSGSGTASAAIALAAALDGQASGLSAGEDVLLREWLARLGAT